MIRFALQCDQGHGFEGWFRDNAGYEEQAKAGFVACPHCGSARVEKQIMAPAVARTDRGRRPAVEAAPSAPAPSPASPADPASPMADPPMPGPSMSGPSTAALPMAALPPEMRAMREMLRAFRQHVESTADHVGDRFADEARKMHQGEIEHRPIYGSATPEEVRELKEEGVEAYPLPILPDDRN